MLQATGLRQHQSVEPTHRLVNGFSGTAKPRSWWSVPASAIIPGLGQAVLGVNRAIPYSAIELFAWTAYVDQSTTARLQRRAYRVLADQAARSTFTTEFPTGDFEYYEHMAHFVEAGQYDRIPGGELDPETDPATFNGAIWALARRTFWPQPDVPPDTSSDPWKRAISMYRMRAYPEAYRWSWRNTPTEYRRFQALIEDSNEAARQSRQAVGVLIANHLLSAIDAYIVVRVRRLPQAFGDAYALTARLPWSPFSR